MPRTAQARVVVVACALVALLGAGTSTQLATAPALQPVASGAVGSPPAQARSPASPRRTATGRGIVTEQQLRAAWSDPMRTRLVLGADIVLRDCLTGDPVRESPYPPVLDGRGHDDRADHARS